MIKYSTEKNIVSHEFYDFLILGHKNYSKKVSHGLKYTVCPRSLDPVCVVTYVL